MKIKTKIVIIIPLIVLAGLLITQFLIVKNSLKIEEENKKIIAETIKLEQSNFNSEVTLALTKVRDKLISLNKENSNIYLDPVKQIQDNYFVVSFYDTIPKTLLGNLIKEEFQSFYIDQNYKIGVYDCFTDSIIFDKFTNLETKFSLKWDHDGYYFGVFFTDFKKVEPQKNSSLPYMLILASLVIIVAILFTFYLANGILKQKRISKITYDFINNMTHELKTPISTISLSTDVLIKSQENNKDERLKRYLGIIKTENKRLENQVERVLEIAKLDKNKINLNFETLDIHEIITTCTDTFSVPIQERDGNISTNLKAKNSLVNGDIIHVTNIIYNLFDNANKYTPNKPTITISSYNSGDNINIEVSDNGIGVKKEDYRDIFNKFYRVSTGDVHNVKGFGLGLYYVNQMMLKHEGSIEIKSIFNKGSVFTLTFPSIK